MASPEAHTAPRRDFNSEVAALIALVSMAAAVAIGIASPGIGDALRDHPGTLVEFLLLTAVLQVFSVPTVGGGSVSVGAVGTIATGMALGPGPAMVVAALAAVAQWIRSRGLLHRAIFDSAQWALSAGAAALVYHGVASHLSGPTGRVLGAVCAGVACTGLNHALLCTAIGLDQGISAREVWRERFRWARFHFLAFGPLALAAVEGKHAIGLVGLVAFALPPGLLLLSVRQYIERTKEALERERAAKERYREQSEDMAALFELAGSLAVRSHDRRALTAYAERHLAGLLGAKAAVIDSTEGVGTPLATGGKTVGHLRFVPGEGFDAARWERLAPAVVPHLATAIETADLVERIWRTHLETIAALSRSMEAKDYYTGGHTERVAAIAVALARRLGYEGPELDAIEVGALLHDVGKIGIPERILNKPGALSSEEWQVMKEHPVLSEYILSEVELHPFVRQIARSSHERYDGAGYPDHLAGEQIPLPARIALVADAVDAMTTQRPYRRARPLLAALQEIREHAGDQFCPTVVAALEDLFREEPHLLGLGYLDAVGGAA